MQTLPLWVRRVPIRLTIVVLLSLLVASACYGVSVSLVGQTLMSRSSGRPSGRGPGNAVAKPSTVAPTSGATDPSASTSVPTGSGDSAPQAAPLARPPGGGGRPASWSRGLPELTLNVGVIATLIVIVTFVQARLRGRRRPRARASLA